MASVKGISPDGNFVQFESTYDLASLNDIEFIGFWEVPEYFIGTDLTATASQTFIKNLTTEEFTPVTTDANGNFINYGFGGVIFSDDYRYAAFNSDDLSEFDNNGSSQLYVKDLDSNEILLVSKNHNGTLSDEPSTATGFSPDGSLLTFTSSANNIDVGNDNRNSVFLVSNPF